MDNLNIKISTEISKDLTKRTSEIMPSGRICVCCTSDDLDYAKSVISDISSFDYDISFIEYPDATVPDDENIMDVVESDEDIRLFVGVGGRVVAELLARACAIRESEYIFVANTPDLYGVAYSLGKVEPFENSEVKPPHILYVDENCTQGKKGYASLVGIILGHAVELFEKEYINRLSGRFDEHKLEDEKALLYGIISSGDMSDRKRLLENEIRLSKCEREEFCSAQRVLVKLIEDMSLVSDRGESSLLAAVTLIKYFKAVLSVEEANLTLPSDLSEKCRNVSKLVGTDMSEIIKRVEKRTFHPEWLFVHREYREDMLKEIKKLESKLPAIIRSAKRFMPDAGYHLSEEYDSNMLIQAVYNLSPLTDEASIVSVADCLGIS